MWIQKVTYLRFTWTMLDFDRFDRDDFEFWRIFYGSHGPQERKYRTGAEGGRKTVGP